VLLLVFTVIGLCAMVVAYAFALGGAVSCLIFLAIVLVGVSLRVAEPLLNLIRP
jgi:hypothetical protein